MLLLHIATTNRGEVVSHTAVSERMLNVALAPESATHRHLHHPRPQSGGGQPSAHLATGFQPQHSWNLTSSGGPTIAQLTFVNRYVGGAAAWSPPDMTSIDGALSAAMSDAGLQSVIEQYFPGENVTSTMLPSAVHDGAAPVTVYKDTAEALAQQIYNEGAIGGADPKSTVICMMLPQGIVLSDDFSPGFTPPAGVEAGERHERRARRILKIDEGDAADSRNGLGGYHGSVHLADGTEIFYAVGVYSEGANGIDAFGVPWKNVVATFYHELNEARTDAAVEDVNSTNDAGLLGWYSQTGQGEIGDLPINDCNGKLGLVFVEVPLANGNGTVPIQLMWSNADDGPAAATG
jgi:hypothetical protein